MFYRETMLEFLEGIYFEKECNDVAVCRVWRYGLSSQNTTRYELLLLHLWLETQ
jgi:hypothetical protein